VNYELPTLPTLQKQKQKMAPTKKANASAKPKASKAKAEAAVEPAKESEGCKKILDDIDGVLDSMDDVLKAFMLFIGGEDCTVADPVHLERALRKIHNKAEKQILVLINTVAAYD
jgi:hypothetical protein